MRDWGKIIVLGIVGLILVGISAAIHVVYWGQNEAWFGVIPAFLAGWPLGTAANEIW